MTHQIGLFVIVSRALLNFNRRPVGTCRHRGQDKSAVPGLPASLFFFLDFVFLFKSTWPLRKTNPPSLDCQRSLFFFLDLFPHFKSTWPLRKTNPPSLDCRRHFFSSWIFFFFLNLPGRCERQIRRL